MIQGFNSLDNLSHGDLDAQMLSPQKIWTDMAGLGVRVVSDMDRESSRCAEETYSAKCSSTSAPPGSSLSCRGHPFLFTSSSGYLRGIPSRTRLWPEGLRPKLARNV